MQRRGRRARRLWRSHSLRGARPETRGGGCLTPHVQRGIPKRPSIVQQFQRTAEPPLREARLERQDLLLKRNFEGFHCGSLFDKDFTDRVGSVSSTVILESPHGFSALGGDEHAVVAQPHRQRVAWFDQHRGRCTTAQGYGLRIVQCFVVMPPPRLSFSAAARWSFRVGRVLPNHAFTSASLAILLAFSNSAMSVR